MLSKHCTTLRCALASCFSFLKRTLVGFICVLICCLSSSFLMERGIHYTNILWFIQCIISYERRFCFKRKKRKGKILNTERTWSWGGREDLGGVISRKNIIINLIWNSQISKNIKKNTALNVFYVLWCICVYAFIGNAQEGSYWSYCREDATFDFTTQLPSFPA